MEATAGYSTTNSGRGGREENNEDGQHRNHKKAKTISATCDQCFKRKINCTIIALNDGDRSAEGQQVCEQCVANNRLCIFSAEASASGMRRTSENGGGGVGIVNAASYEPFSPSSHSSSAHSSTVPSTSHNGQDWSLEIGNNINNRGGRRPAAPTSPRNNDITQWTHETFLSATVKNSISGNVVPWWEIYYTYIHPKWTFIFKGWFLTHYKDLPLILLHAMYGCCFFYTAETSAGEVHFSACKAVIDEAIENPDPLKTAAIMLMSVYSINSKRIKSSVSYLCLAIRFCQILGIDKDKYDVWRGNPAFSSESPKEFCRSLWVCLYAHDFYAIFLIGVPGSVTLEIDTRYLQHYRNGTFSNSMDDVKSYLCFQSYYIPLILIGRKSLRLSGNAESVVLSRKMLLSRLDDWFLSVANFDPFPQTSLPYLNMCNMPFLFTIYHFIRLQLLKPAFLEAISLNMPNEPVVVQVLESATAISKSIRSYLLYNQQLVNLTLLMKYCVFFAGAFHIAHAFLFPASALVGKLGVMSDHIKFLETFGLIHPQCLLDVKTLMEWLSNPQAQGAISFLKEKNF